MKVTEDGKYVTMGKEFFKKKSEGRGGQYDETEKPNKEAKNPCITVNNRSGKVTIVRGAKPREPDVGKPISREDCMQKEDMESEKWLGRRTVVRSLCKHPK